MLKGLDIERYVKDIKIDEKATNKKYVLATYTFRNQIYLLKFFLQSFRTYFDTDEELNKLSGGYTKLFYKNLFFVKVIRHEIEHAYQEFLKLSGTDLESKILQNSCLITRSFHNNLLNNIEQKKYRKKYYKYYDFDPKERLAELKASMLILKISKLANIPEITQANNHMLDEYIYNTYANSISPTIYYLKQMHLTNFLKQFSWYCEDAQDCLDLVSQYFSFATRIYLGLPISNSERGILYQECEANVESSLLRKKL